MPSNETQYSIAKPLLTLLFLIFIGFLSYYIHVLRPEFDALERNNATLQEMITQITNSSNDLKTRNAELVAKNLELGEELVFLDDNVELLKKERDDLTAENISLKNEQIFSNTRIEALKARIEKYKEGIEQLLVENEKLKDSQHLIDNNVDLVKCQETILVLQSIIERYENDAPLFYDNVPDFFSIYFKFDSYEIDLNSHAILAIMAMTIDESVVRIEVDGYADRSGRAEYNRILSEKRGEVVTHVIKSVINRPVEITYTGHGEIGDINGVRSRENRRADIRVIRR